MPFSSGGIPAKARIDIRTVLDVPRNTFQERVCVPVDFLGSSGFSRLLQCKPEDRDRVMKEEASSLMSKFAITFLLLDGTTPAGKRKLGGGGDGEIVELQSFITDTIKSPKERGGMFTSMEDFRILVKDKGFKSRKGQGLLVVCEGTGEADTGMKLVELALKELGVKPLPLAKLGNPISEVQAEQKNADYVHPYLKNPYTDIDYHEIGVKEGEKAYSEDFIRKFAQRVDEGVKDVIVPKEGWWYVCLSRDGDIARIISEGTVIEILDETPFGMRLQMYDIEKLNETIGIAGLALQRTLYTTCINNQVDKEKADSAKLREEEMNTRIAEYGEAREQERCIGVIYLAELCVGDNKSFALESKFHANVKNQPVNAAVSTRVTRSNKDADLAPPAPLQAKPAEPDKAAEPSIPEEEMETGDEELDEDEEFENSTSKKLLPATALNIIKNLFMTDLNLTKVGNMILNAEEGKYRYATPKSLVGFFTGLTSNLFVHGFPCNYLD